MTTLPRIGLLGIMQELYDDMIPGITEHQARFAAQVAERLSGVAQVVFERPARNQDDIETLSAQLLADGVDGVMIVMLTYGPAMRSIRALRTLRNVPVLLANIQPEREITADWNMDSLTYNQGIHGAQDQANALVRADVPFSVITGDWQSDAFAGSFGDWARAALAISTLRRSRLALIGYPMNGMGDITYDHEAMLRRIGTTVVSQDLGHIVARIQAVSDADVQAVIAEHRERFAMDPKLTEENHAYAVRFELALRALMQEGGYAGFSFHFDAIGGDGRFRQLPILAASNLMADGYAFAAEGDTNTAMLMIAAQAMIGDAHFSEMYAMDWARDSILISHMGEGNWKVARSDRPVRLIDRPLGIGGLDNPPTPVFAAEPGRATTAALIPIEGDYYRLLVGHGEVLDTPELPHVEMHSFHLRPDAGMEAFMDDWLRFGGPHHFVTTLGEHAGRWRAFAELLELDYEEI
ncbi:MAG TPA: L-fucose/L-arabinose isomerase family protein [Solirubrobacteraceae bacterium]|nr:L-fucose/L-arabinose isomerase family protein [Solirubrobacteraceae bacterium]